MTRITVVAQASASGVNFAIRVVVIKHAGCWLKPLSPFSTSRLSGLSWRRSRASTTCFDRRLLTGHLSWLCWLLVTCRSVCPRMFQRPLDSRLTAEGGDLFPVYQDLVWSFSEVSTEMTVMVILVCTFWRALHVSTHLLRMTPEYWWLGAAFVHAGAFS